MDEFFDRIARILATPMPRKTALRLILGAVTAPLAFGQACPSLRQCPGVGGGACCPAGEKCCKGGPNDRNNYCCPESSVCCGLVCCPPDKECKDRTCKGNTLTDALLFGAAAGAAATPFAMAQGGPCPDIRKCPGMGFGSCCPEGQKCCPLGPGNSRNFCCPVSSVCCGSVCCPPDRFCENGTNCRTRTPSDPTP